MRIIAAAVSGTALLLLLYSPEGKRDAGWGRIDQLERKQAHDGTFSPILALISRTSGGRAPPSEQPIGAEPRHPEPRTQHHSEELQGEAPQESLRLRVSLEWI